MSDRQKFDRVIDGKPYDTDGKLIETCIERIYDAVFSGTHACGKRLKGDEEFPYLCGLHVSMIHRRKAKDAEQIKQREAERQAREETKTRIDALADLGLDLRPSGYNDSRVSVSLEQLEALAELVRTYVPSEARGGETPWFRQFG